MSKVNKISICNAIKKAKIEVKGISEEKETTIDLNVDSDIFPSETFKFANSSWFDPKIIGEFKSKNTSEWNKKDFLEFVRHSYFEKFVSTPVIPPAYGYMYLNVIEEICIKNFPSSNFKLLKAMYISWYFKNFILKHTVKNTKYNWNIKKMVLPEVVASFIMHFSGNTEFKEISLNIQKRLPVNESLLDIYFRGPATHFIKLYGVIIPFAFLFYSKKLSWDDCLEYVVNGLKDLASARKISDKLIVKVTESYAPYDQKFNKILPDKILAELTNKTGINFTGVKIK